ncbi:MAG TPA: patatin-like phospholipase family protein, partial [Longimicrobiaceae bacterium]|nr:patatin-like phospholipase family protein [Longimicrobiaceae bacterium]
MKHRVPGGEQTGTAIGETSAPGPPTQDTGDLAIVMTGGGARAAYQVGLLRFLARRYPELRFRILSGVSAGAVNAAHLAQHHGTFPQAVDELTSLWQELTSETVFRSDASSLLWNVVRSGAQLVAGGTGSPRLRGMVDTEPLREFLTEALAPVDGELTGIQYNLNRGVLSAVAISTTSYTTGQSITWVQGRDIAPWERPKRQAVKTKIGVGHIMASAALPILFPAVQIGPAWYGDGGIRLSAPLSPALHLGAHKILAVSNRYVRTHAEAGRVEVVGYPPPAQVLGVLYNAVFLDLIDQDALRLDRMNRVLEKLPDEQREGMRVVDLMVLRPSRDLGRLARYYEPRLPGTFRFLTRGWGTRQTTSPDILSMMMFQHEFIRRLIELGELDAEVRADEI